MTISPYTGCYLQVSSSAFSFGNDALARISGFFFIYGAALVGAFFGAKLVYFFAEGWLHVGGGDMWLQLATGKSILGALLGGYAFVELAKRQIGYRRATGDDFALIAPISIGLGRIGCLLHGCCLGVVCRPEWYALRDAEGTPRWPAVPVELGFNAGTFFLFLFLRHRKILPGQHFHLYLIGYGLFRFAHEFARATPKIVGAFSGYHFAAIGVALLGLVGFLYRRSSVARGAFQNHERPEGGPSPKLA